MHRTLYVPRLLGWWSLLLTLMLHVGVPGVFAQNSLQPASYTPGQPDNPNRSVIEIAAGSSRAFQMSSKADLKRVENPNSRVVRVERIDNKNNEVMLVAELPGRSLVTLFDRQDRAEVFEVVVLQGKEIQAAQKLVIPLGDAVTQTLKKAPIGGTQATKGGVVQIIAAKDDPLVFSIRGIGAGSTTVVFFTDKERTERVTFDIEVVAEDRAAQLRKLIEKLVPTASVTVTPTKIPRRLEDRKGVEEDAVILTGTAQNAFDVKMIFDAATSLFPPSEFGVSAQPVGGAGVAQQSILNSNVINRITIGGVHQVQLDVVVAIVNRSEARNMSFSFNATGKNFFISSLIGGPGLLNSALAVAPGASNSNLNGTGANIPFGVINGDSSLNGFLQLLRTEGLLKILSEPKVVTLSGRPGVITSGGETPVLTSSGQGAPSVSFKQFGTVVKFLPIVLGNGKIHLEVNPEISNLNAAAGINIGGLNPTVVPGFDTRSAQVTVIMEDGQTLAIGGLIQNRVNASISRVPVLGDLPYLGMLFTSKAYREEEEELIILVTPRLVDPVDCHKIPKYLPGRETRSPDDFEFFLEGLMEAPRGQRSVVFHPSLYRGAHTGASNYGQYPCGNTGCGIRGHHGGPGCANGSCAPSHAAPIQVIGSQQSRVSVPTTIVTESTPIIPQPSITVIGEPKLPTVSIPVRDAQPNLGPATTTPPTVTLPPAREEQPRPVLPPISNIPIIR